MTTPCFISVAITGMPAHGRHRLASVNEACRLLHLPAIEKVAAGAHA